jgi:GNAT superfamily N-acetyltransferase
MTVNVRFASSEDAPAVRDTALRAFAEMRGLIDPPPGILFESEEDVRRAIETEGAVVAEDRSIVVGSARFEVKPEFLYIGRLAVPPEHRGRGIGGTLLAFLEQHARELGLSETHVSVREALTDNLAMFEHWGYLPVTRDPHPRVPTAYSIGMVKQIRQKL